MRAMCNLFIDLFIDLFTILFTILIIIVNPTSLLSLHVSIVGYVYVG